LYSTSRAVARQIFVSGKAWNLRPHFEKKKNILLCKAKFSKIRIKLSFKGHHFIMLSGKIRNYNPKSAPLQLCALGRGPRGPVFATALSTQHMYTNIFLKNVNNPKWRTRKILKGIFIGNVEWKISNVFI